MYKISAPLKVTPCNNNTTNNVIDFNNSEIYNYDNLLKKNSLIGCKSINDNDNEFDIIYPTNITNKLLVLSNNTTNIINNSSSGNNNIIEMKIKSNYNINSIVNIYTMRNLFFVKTGNVYFLIEPLDHFATILPTYFPNIIINNDVANISTLLNDSINNFFNKIKINLNNSVKFNTYFTSEIDYTNLSLKIIPKNGHLKLIAILTNSHGNNQRYIWEPLNFDNDDIVSSHYTYEWKSVDEILSDYQIEKINNSDHTYNFNLTQNVNNISNANAFKILENNTVNTWSTTNSLYTFNLVDEFTFDKIGYVKVSGSFEFKIINNLSTDDANASISVYIINGSSFDENNVISKNFEYVNCNFNENVVVNILDTLHKLNANDDKITIFVKHNLVENVELLNTKLTYFNVKFV